MRQHGVTRRRSPIVGLVMALALFGGATTIACASAAPQAKIQSGVATIEAAGETLAVEIAADPASREQGLMYRPPLADDAGMLFVFPNKALHGFWMMNTPNPLSIAFLDDDGTIVNIDDMAPYTEDVHKAQKPVRFALEVNQGWFAKRKITAGKRLVLHLPDGLVGR